ncbi:hypothetical protein QQ045_008752 [Rhodiola kirilowii]
MVWSRVDLIKPSFLTRSINCAYHNYSIPPAGYWPEYHLDRIDDERSPSFHPGVYGPHPRFGYQFRGPYPVGGAWRSFGPEYRVRCCGCQQFLPVNYGGSWNWNPNAGMYRGGVVQGNGYVDQGINYNRGDWSHSFRNNTAGGSGNFNGNDGRNLGPYGANSTDFPRNQNENEVRDYTANQNQNVGQHRQNLGDSYNERQEVPRVNGFEEQNIVHDGYRRPQGAYRWNNHNFTENDERDGRRDQGAWTQSRSSYNPYGPEHNFHSESERLNQGTGYVDRKNVNTDDHTRPSNNGGAIGGQFQNSTINGRPLNSNGAGGGEEYKRTGQSSRVPNVLRKDNNHGSNEHNWNFTSQSDSDYSRDQVMGSNGHENLNGRVHSRPEVENNNNVNLGHKDNINGDRWIDAKDQPEKFTVKEQPANMIDKRGNLHQSPETCHQASNETATDSQRHLGVQNIERKEKQQPRDNRPGHENSKAFQQILNMSHGKILSGNPIGGQFEKRFNVANNGEASRVFQDNKGAKQDGVIAWDDESWNGSDLGNLYDPLPDFTANERLNPSKINAQMLNINDTGNNGGRPPRTIVHDSNDATRMSIDALHRYQGIIDLLESEDVE